MQADHTRTVVVNPVGHFPGWLTDRREITRGSRRLYVELWKCARGWFCYPKAATLAARLGWSRRTVCRYLNELRAARLIVSERVSGQHTRYWFVLNRLMPETVRRTRRQLGYVAGWIAAHVTSHVTSLGGPNAKPSLWLRAIFGGGSKVLSRMLSLWREHPARLPGEQGKSDRTRSLKRPRGGLRLQDLRSLEAVMNERDRQLTEFRTWIDRNGCTT